MGKKINRNKHTEIKEVLKNVVSYL